MTDTAPLIIGDMDRTEHVAAAEKHLAAFVTCQSVPLDPPRGRAYASGSDLLLLALVHAQLASLSHDGTA